MKDGILSFDQFVMVMVNVHGLGLLVMVMIMVMEADMCTLHRYRAGQSGQRLQAP